MEKIKEGTPTKELTCQHCGKSFLVSKYRLNSRDCKFCSRKCHSLAMRKYQFWTPENWNDGFPDKKTYIVVYRPDYPKADFAGRAKRSHVVWWLHTGQVVEDGFCIHHKNHNKQDDCFENLEHMLHGDHTAEHLSLRFKDVVRIKRLCQYCKQPFIILESALRYNPGKFCSKQCASNSRKGINPFK